jgi:hypothetical protein
MVSKLKLMLGLLAAGASIGAWPMRSCYTGIHNFDFYWAAAGNDANDCSSPATPCLTIARLNSFPFPNNATAHLNGGDTFAGGIVVSNANLTITSYGTGQAIVSSGNSAACVSATNIDNVKINNITCTGGGTATNLTDGILIYNSSTGSAAYVAPTITNNTISGYGANCVDIIVAGTGGTSTSKFSGTTNINGNTLHDCTGNAPAVAAPGSSGLGLNACVRVIRGQYTFAFDTVNINNNTIFNCQGPTVATTFGTGFGIWLSDVGQGCSVSNNLIHDTGLHNGTSPGPAGLILLRISPSNTGCVLRFNEVYNSNSGVSGDGNCLDLDLGTNNVTVQYNFVHDCTVSGYQTGNFGGSNTNNIFRFNIWQGSYSNSEGGMSLQEGANTSGDGQPNGFRNIAVYNNTFIANGLFGTGANTQSVCAFGSGGGAVNPFQVNFSNNICFTANTAAIPARIVLNLAAPNSFVLTGNDYFSAGGGAMPSVTVDNGVTIMTSLAALHAAGFEQTPGPINVGTIGNPNFTGTPPLAIPCGGYNGTCPAGATLANGTTAGKGKGLNLNSLYSFNVGTQDYYGNAVTNTTLPIGAAANQ